MCKMSFGKIMFPVISFLAALRLLTEAHSCNNGRGIYVYEKIPDYVLSEGYVGETTKVEVVTKTGVGGDVARECGQICLKNQNCFSFGFLPGKRRSSPYAPPTDNSWRNDLYEVPTLTADYDESVCYIYQNKTSAVGTEILVKRPMSWHFNKICLTSQKLTSAVENSILFAFLRVPGYKFEGENDKDVFAANVSECESKCFEEDMCRSATYNMAGQRCRMSTQTRMMNPKNYTQDGNSEYLENMGLPFRERCPSVEYALEAKKAVEELYEAALLSVWDTEQCSKQCELAQTFTCHGFHINEVSRTCILYDEEISGYNEIPRPQIDSSGSLHKVICNTLDRDGFNYTCLRRKRLDVEHQVEVKAHSFQECLDECVKRLGHSCQAVTYSSGYLSCRFSTDQDNKRSGRPKLVDDKYYDYYELKWLRGAPNQGHPGYPGGSHGYQGNHFGSRSDNPGNSYGPFGPGGNYGGQFGPGYIQNSNYGHPHGGGYGGIQHGSGYGGMPQGSGYGGIHHGSSYGGRPGSYERNWHRPGPSYPYGHRFRPPMYPPRGPPPIHGGYPPLPPRGPPFPQGGGHPPPPPPFMPGGSPEICKPGMLGMFRRVGTGLRMRNFYIRRVVRAERIEECEKACMDEKDFSCVAFNFRAVFPDNCELTDQDSRQLQLINPAHFEKDSQFDYYEREGYGTGNSGCMDVSQSCSLDGMEFSLKTTEPFFGRIYTYGFYDSCFFDGNGGTVNVLRISRPNGFPRCGTQQYGDSMTNIVVVQFNDYVQTSRDKKYNLTCYLSGPGEAVVTSNYLDARVDGRRFPTQIEHLPAQDMLTSIIRLIISYRGTPTNTIAVGDLLTFRLEARGHFQYDYYSDIFATNVIAKDPYSGRQVHLIDAKGCPVDLYVFPELHRTPDGALEAEFYAFKIPDSNLLVFQATVRTCRGPCEPVICNDRDRPGSFPSWGRKKRSVVDPNSNSNLKADNVTEEEEDVHELFKVYFDRTDIPPNSPKSNKITKAPVCTLQSGYYTLMAVVIVLICVILAMSIAAVFFIRKYKLAKKECNTSGTNRGLSNLYISRYPATGRIEDPSEPIYTDPALFESARNIRPTTLTQFGRTKPELD
ncbi:uncharacterized protein [Centruroides vittatus]|uniref:uncharacterized protein n=1 Tax=Centruroides vittatus TaxID=120091 RepID=UPI0035107105